MQKKRKKNFNKYFKSIVFKNIESKDWDNLFNLISENNKLQSFLFNIEYEFIIIIDFLLQIYNY